MHEAQQVLRKNGGDIERAIALYWNPGTPLTFFWKNTKFRQTIAVAGKGMNPMLFRLFLLFSIVPIIEIWLLIKVGKVIGALPTICLLLFISMVGAWLAKSQGLRTLAAVRDELGAGRLPAARLLDGAMILAGAILLLTPGFFTDFIGLFFLFPASRTLLKGWLRNFLERELSRGTIIIHRR